MVLYSPWIGGFGDTGPKLVRRNLGLIVAKFFQESLVNVHWKELVIRFSFKFALASHHESAA